MLYTYFNGMRKNHMQTFEKGVCFPNIGKSESHRNVLASSWAIQLGFLYQMQTSIFSVGINSPQQEYFAHNFLNIKDDPAFYCF